MPLEDRKQIDSEVTGELFHLKNSVEKHGPEAEWAAIHERIATTTDRIQNRARQLKQPSWQKTARYLRRWLSSMTTFAAAATEGFEVPWTSNPVDRAMGEVSKRCKHQWMQWAAAGLEPRLQLRLTKCVDPTVYDASGDHFLKRSTKTTKNCALSVEAIRGKFQTKLERDQFG